MPACTDLEHMRGIRQVLVKNWIDLGRMRITCQDGHVKLHGTITALFGSNINCTAEQASRIVDMISQLPQTATIDFDGLKLNGGTPVTSAVVHGND